MLKSIYAVIRSVVSALDIVASSSAAHTGLIASVVSCQQSTRISEALNNTYPAHTSKRKSKI